MTFNNKDTLYGRFLKTRLIIKLDQAFDPKDIEKGTAQFRQVRRQNIFLLSVLIMCMLGHFSCYLGGVHPLYHVLFFEMVLVGCFVIYPIAIGPTQFII